MMLFAKLSTAKTIVFGPILDSTGAEYTGAVVADVKIAKNNGTPAALNGSATLTHKEVGYYELVLTTSDISEVGVTTIVLSKTTYLAPPVVLNVLPANVYDSLVGGTDQLQVDVTQWLGSAVATPSVAGVPEVDVTHILGTASVGDPGYVGTDHEQIANPMSTQNLSGTTVAGLSAAGLTAVAAAVWNALTSGLSTVGSVGKLIVDYLDAAVSSRISVTLSRPGVVPSNELTNGTITANRGDVWTQQITDLGDLTDATGLALVLKESPSDSDDEAAVHVLFVVGDAEASGLITINGEAADTAENGSIVIDDDEDGDITCTIAGVEMAKLGDDDSTDVLSRALPLPVKEYFYDVQKFTADGGPVTIARGKFRVVSDINRATALPS